MFTRGETLLVEFSPSKGREQRGSRPAVIISNDQLSNGPGGLLVVLPVTTTDRRVPLHVKVEPPEGGLHRVSFIMVDQIRAISASRVRQTIGQLTPPTMKEIDDRLRIVLDLGGP